MSLEELTEGRTPIKQAERLFKNKEERRVYCERLLKAWPEGTPQHQLFHELYLTTIPSKDSKEFSTFESLANYALGEAAEKMIEACGVKKEDPLLARFCDIVRKLGGFEEGKGQELQHFIDQIKRHAAVCYKAIHDFAYKDLRGVELIQFKNSKKDTPQSILLKAIVAHQLLYNCAELSPEQNNLELLAESAFAFINYISELYKLNLDSLKEIEPILIPLGRKDENGRIYVAYVSTEDIIREQYSQKAK
ncbi:MAG: hypothetical protein QW063_01515 [Candidatus Nanoarchaeia archaeon]